MQKSIRTNLSQVLVFLLMFIAQTSCNEDYDLNNEINTDVNLLPNLYLPIGDTEQIYLSEIIETSDELIINNDGIYEISATSSISSSIESISKITIEGMSPNIEDVNIEVSPIVYTTQTTNAEYYPQYSDFDVDAQFNINQDLPDDIDALYAAILVSEDSDNLPVSITIDVPDIPLGVDKLLVHNFTVKIPAIFISEEANSDNEITYEDFELDGDLKTHTITFTISEIKIPDGEEDIYIQEINNDKYLLITDAINLSAELTTYVTPILTAGTTITLELDCLAPNAIITDLQGKLSTNDIIESEMILGELPDFIADEENIYTPSDISIYLNTENPINANLTTDISIIAYDKENEQIGESVIIPLTLVPNSNNILISNVAKSESGYTNIVDSNLTTLFSTIPNQVSIYTDQVIAETIDDTQLFELGKGYDITGNIEAKIPLEFENIQLTYSDEFDDLGSDISDFTDLTNQLIVTANVENSIPTELTFAIECYDYNNQKIDGISVDSSKFIISPAKADGTIVTSEVELTLTETTTGALAELNTIKYTVKAESLESGITLKETQYIQIKDIKVQIPNGINL